MNNHQRLGSRSLSATFGGAFALYALLSAGCNTTVKGGTGAGADFACGGCITSPFGGTGGDSGGATPTGGAGTTGGTTSGITTFTLPPCDSFLAAAMPIGFNLIETGLTPQAPIPGSPNIDLSVSGTVTSVGTGNDFVECGTIPPDLVGTWASFADADGKSWTVCFAAPNASWSIGVGDSITASLHVDVGYYTPNSSELTVRKGGALAFYGLGNTGATIHWPQEISVADGDPICFNESWDTCAKTGLQAVVSSGGETVKLLPGTAPIVVGDFRVGLGNWFEITDGGSCDAGDARKSLFVVPAP